jgi:hypothetical protein
MASQEVRIGTHVFCRLTPEVGKVTLRGTYGLDDIRALCEEWGRFWKPEDALYLLNDIRELREAGPELRQYAGEWFRQRKGPSYIALVGGSLPIRTLGILFGQAVRLLTAGLELKTFPDERSALAWFRDKGARI